MSIISKSAPPLIERLPARKSRSTFTQNNASQFQAIFDKIISTGEAQLIPYDSVSVTPNTLQVKVHDALGWLAENSPHPHYKELKTLVTVRQEASGLTIRLKQSFNGSSTLLATPTKSGWQNNLVEFLAQAAEGEVKVFNDVTLLGDEGEILIGICAGVATFSYDKALKTLTVIKGL